MSYPNYPGYPSSNQDLQINQSFNQQSAYPITSTSPVHSSYPGSGNQPSPSYASYPGELVHAYPSYPTAASNQYLPSGTSEYPPQQPHYPPSVSYPQYSPINPQGVGYPGGFLPSSGCQPFVSSGSFKSTRPLAPPSSDYHNVQFNQPIVSHQQEHFAGPVLPLTGGPSAPSDGGLYSSTAPFAPPPAVNPVHQSNQPSAPDGLPSSTMPFAQPPSESKSFEGLYPSVSGVDLPIPAVVTILQSKVEQNIPTVHQSSSFDVREDASALQKAMKGLGTDEKALINVLCHRTRSQRTAINYSYKSAFGKDLEPRLKSELSGSFKKIIVALCLPMDEFMAREMNKALSGKGTDEETAMEILCNATNQEIREMNAAYQRAYGHILEHDIKGDTSGAFRNLLVALTQGQRDEDQSVDIQKAKDDAQHLYEAGVAKKGTDENVFTSVLATRSWAYIRQLMVEYETMYSHSLEKAVISEYSATKEKALLAILQCAQNRPLYFAQRLNNAMKGLGTKNRNLIRIIVMRCDIDLGNIKREYEKKFSKSLITDVTGDTSGDYKKALLALLG